MVVVVAAVALASTHLAPTMDHVGMHDAMAVCLALSETAAAMAVLRRPRRLAPARPRFQTPLPADPPLRIATVRARAGPPDLQVFLR